MKNKESKVYVEYVRLFLFILFVSVLTLLIYIDDESLLFLKSLVLATYLLVVYKCMVMK